MKILELWRELWREVTKTRYTQALEAEVARLRAENRAMLNSILGIAGVPPIPAQENDVAAVRESAGGDAGSGSGRSSRPTVPAGSQRNPGIQVATPLVAPD